MSADRTVTGVWIHPSTRKAHAVIGYRSTGYRLACRPNMPTRLTLDDLLDYRFGPTNKCWNEACWRHFFNPESSAQEQTGEVR